MVETSSRPDGRSDFQIRSMSTMLSLLQRADGSARFTLDKSSALAAVYGPKEVKVREEQIDRAFIDVNMKPLIGLSGTTERHYERVIKELASSLILSTMHPRTAIEITIQVMSDDGGMLSTAINAAVLALLDAGVPLKAMAASVTCITRHDGTLVLDPTLEEIKDAASTHVFAFDNVNPEEVLTVVSTGVFDSEEVYLFLSVKYVSLNKEHPF
ncbi:ribosomal protein S5 domain 2-type protein [Chytridium lagenaria]|nr:ribosomal protein S5 domain 2-type protein [Chytridium lagenaria]